jgi:creatinine amidohydrolase/Fe(II)-dependent formamide hydrolase-like protein
VAPTIAVGMAQHHLGFAGSMTLRPSTLIAVLRDTVESSGQFADAADYRRNFPDGRMVSNPGLATPEAGRLLYDAPVAALTNDYLSWVAT